MGINELDETGRQFMIQLFEQTRGDLTLQVSMYDIGSLLELERDAASRVAEELMGLQMVEIRTLSGGIGISAAGSEMVQELIGPLTPEVGAPIALGHQPLLNSAGRQALEEILMDIKDKSGSLGLDFNSLTELMADLKTIDAQLGSSRPKTSIVRVCMHSISGVVKETANRELSGRISGLLDD
ncbi:hypothetical protein JY97_01765 [Alkalispirochaeta odontotermitis]|nr:hypothetical protein JY97_01765 [Alkalispirochaeta odontotermitis]CAB1074631.1 hypothetical protein D1AOALGA4SA_2450 [Olavius algarvensis Delta 1 endosymbiont]